MSNIVSIQGYTLHTHNGEPMVGDLELAQRLGYSEPRMIRKLIKRLIESGRILPEGVCTAVSQSPGGGRPSTVYHLGEKATLKVIVKSETEKSDQITDEIIDVFIAARNGKSIKPKRYVDPLIEQHRQAVGICRATLQLAKMMGTDLPMARAIAGQRVEEVTGIDLKPMLSNNSVKEEPVTPTTLGKELGISGKAMNKALVEAGLQTNVDGAWEPTDKAKGLYSKNPLNPKTAITPAISCSGTNVYWKASQQNRRSCNGDSTRSNRAFSTKL